MRVNNDHWNVLVTFAEKHPQIITNKFVGQSGRQVSIQNWKELTEKLNCLGYGEKTQEEWKKALTDWKSKTKAKAAKIRSSFGKTGGGEGSSVVLSSVEERLLNIMGKTSVEGDCSEEFGFPEQRKTPLERKPLSEQMPTKRKNSELFHESCEPPIKQSVSALPVAGPSIFEEDHVYEVEVPFLDGTPRSRSSSRRNEKKKLEERLIEMNEQTLMVLQNINSNLQGINSSINSLSESVSAFTKWYTSKNM